MCFNQRADIFSQNGWSSKTSRQAHLPRKQRLINREWHQPATTKGIDRYRLAAGHMESGLTDKIKQFFPSRCCVDTAIYMSTTWTLTKRMEKKLDGNYTRILRAILNKSWRKHPTKRQLYGHLRPITKIIQIRRTRNAGHYWRSKDKLLSDVLLWTPVTWTSKGWTTS